MKNIHDKNSAGTRRLLLFLIQFVISLPLAAGIPGYYFQELLYDYSSDNSGSYSTGDLGTQSHPYGMIEDPGGKRWVGFYAGYSSKFARAPGDTLRLTGIRCFLPDGNEAEFSPLEFFEFGDGSRDTLYRNSPYNGNCRGISLSEDGHILYTARSTLMKIDYRDGSGIARWHPGMDDKPVRTFVKAAHDPAGEKIYLAPYPQQESVHILNEDLQLTGTAIARTPTLQNAMITRTTSNGVTQLFSATHAGGKGIFVFESADPGVTPFELVDTLGNYSEMTDSNTIHYIAWPSSLDWLDREEGIIIFGNDYRAVTEVSSGTAPPSPHAARWFIWDVDTDSMIAIFGAPWYQRDDGDPYPREVSSSVPNQFLENQAMCMKPSGAYYADPAEKNSLIITDMELNCVQKLIWSETTVRGEDYIPYAFRLDQNYPNPFNPLTNISFYLPSANEISLEIHDLSGRKLQHIFSGRLDAGKHNILFDAGALPSGNYFYTLRVNAFSVTRKMTVIK